MAPAWEDGQMACALLKVFRSVDARLLSTESEGQA
jgi:hypothetical protein